jgi:hypothetical protein
MMPVHVEEGSELWRAVEAAKDAQAGKWIFNEDGKPDGAVLLVPHCDSLWKAVLAKCEELVPRGAGSSRSTGLYAPDGKSCSAVLERYNHDGTGTVWHVQAYDYIGQGMRFGDISVQVHGPWTDNHDAEWERRLKRDDMSKVVIAGHCWFTIGPGGSGGFGGHRFRFTPLNESDCVVTSNDMWFGGVIPPSWRGRIPDTHEMAEGFYPGPVE